MIIQFLFLLCPKMRSVCQDCGKTFPNLRKLNIHKIVHNNTEVNCNICNVICVGKKKFLDHIKTHQTFECEVCGQTVKTNSKTHHMKTVGNRKLLKNHKSCEFPPLKLPQYLDNSEVIFTFPPDPLHINLLHSFFFIRTKFIRTSSLRFSKILRTNHMLKSPYFCICS